MVHQGGALAYVVVEGEPRFLLITSRRRPDAWIFPKGHIEDDESAEICAQRELLEEAGVSGTVVTALGSVIADLTTATGASAEVHYFLVLEEQRGAAQEGRRREWLPYSRARARLAYDGTRQVLDAAAIHLGLL
jgi:8-oxo-dGTP pyrophosphatase MutT (NUDIX family)